MSLPPLPNHPGADFRELERAESLSGHVLVVGTAKLANGATAFRVFKFRPAVNRWGFIDVLGHEVEALRRALNQLHRDKED
jgi:hypothetical protein